MKDWLVSKPLMVVGSQTCISVDLFLLSLHLYEWCEYFTMNVHDLKNQKKSNAIFIALPHTKKGKEIFSWQ